MTKSQIEAKKRHDKLKRDIKGKLRKVPQSLREIAAKLKLAKPDGSVKSSVAARMIKALKELRDEKHCVFEGNQRSAKYGKA